MLKNGEQVFKSLRDKKPIVLNLTNYVTMDFMANALLSIGASPVMTVCNEELDDLVRIASSININIGTLDKDFIERCNIVTELASFYKKPVILDPVGAGASLIRTKTANSLLEHIAILRGNASEIMALFDHSIKTHGVESSYLVCEAKNAARKLAQRYKITVVVSGEVDFITNATRDIEIPFGSHLMSLVTGMGCVLTSVIAAFRGLLDDSFESSVLATRYFGLCGQLAAKNADSPGAFRQSFIDALYQGSFSEI